MKILCIISGLTQGGAEHVMVELCNQWVNKHDVYLLSFQPKEKDFFVLNARVQRRSLGITTRRFWNITVQHRILQGIRNAADDIKPDIVISFIVKTNIYVQMALGSRPIARILCERNVIFRNDMPWYIHALRKLLYPKATMIGVQTPEGANELLLACPSLKPENVIVLPNPIENSPEIIRQKWTSDQIINVVSLGRMVPVKGFSDIIDMAAMLKSRSERRIHFTIFGNGPLLGELLKRVDRLDVSDLVSLPGFTKDVMGSLSKANVFLSTSAFEGFPMAVSEAMISGLPVVGYNVPGVRYLVNDGDTGILIKEHDIEATVNSILILKNDPDYAVKLGLNGRKKMVDNYSMPIILGIWEDKVFAGL